MYFLSGREAENTKAGAHKLDICPKSFSIKHCVFTKSCINLIKFTSRLINANYKFSCIYKCSCNLVESTNIDILRDTDKTIFFEEQCPIHVQSIIKFVLSLRTLSIGTKLQ